jgi:hypothetical protein
VKRVPCFFIITSVLTVVFLSNPAPSAADDIVTDWNAILRNVMQNVPAKANPGSSTRAMAMTNGAIYDIFQAVDRQYRPLKYNHQVSGVSLEAAVAQAAYRTIIYNYEEQESYVEDQLNLRLGSIADSPEKVAGIALGNLVADKSIAWRDGDGSELSGSFDITNQPGHWQSDPFAANAQTAWGPGWGTVKTFAMLDAQQFTVPGVPDMTSDEYTEAYNEVKEKGALTGSTRTDDETHMGLFWAYDRATMGPPPVMYSQNLHEIGQQMGNTPAQNARMFAMASVAMADASVAAWQVKFQSDFWRPVTAIQQGEDDGNPETEGDLSWRPLGAPGNDPNNFTDDFTPPFPAYVSGHATFGGALYETLRNFYGTDEVSYMLTSAELPAGEDTRSFTDFSTAEWENAMSRIYLGIHWRFDAVDGIALGNEIADWVNGNYFYAVPEPSSLFLASAGIFGLFSRSARCVSRR